jgi:Peptidase family M28
VRKAVIVWGAGLLLVFVALSAATAWYMLGVPGKSFTGPVPPPTSSEEDLAGRLKRHVTAIASVPHNVAHYTELEKSAAYIEGELKALGYTPNAQVFDTDGRSVRNIEVVIEPQGAGPETETLVVGAHYDSAGIAPGANDNGTGTAAVIELARLLKDLAPKSKRLRLVLFVNEEPPYDRSPTMGSWQYAKALKDRGEPVAGMMSLETLGCFSEQPGSQKYPPPFGLFFPSKANFIAFVALPGGRTFLHEVLGAFRRHTQLPTIGGTAPDQFDGVGWSDHWSFAEFGFPGIMLTDTALFRYPHYHKATDTPEKVDYDKLARITLGLEQTLRELVQN